MRAFLNALPATLAPCENVCMRARKLISNDFLSLVNRLDMVGVRPIGGRSPHESAEWVNQIIEFIACAVVCEDGKASIGGQ